jgi:GMP synthase-like glutamine amidotransferase
VRALVISHDPTEQPALIGARLEQHGYDLEAFVVCESTASPESHRAFPSLDGVDVVLAMGAPWSVYDTATIGSWIEREIEFVHEVHARGLPYLGVCFGGQVLAAALGGTVEPAPRPELGWCVVASRAPAIAAGPWLQWHSDRFTLPPGAEELAWNEVGVQAFRMGRSIGVQFHPEVDHRLLSSWLDDGEALDPLFTELGVDPAALIDEAVRIERIATCNADHLVDWLLG